MEPNALTVHANVVALVAAFELAEKRIREHFAAIVQAEKDLNIAFGSDTNHWASFHIDPRGTNFKNPDDTIKDLTRNAWRYIVDRCELRRFMSVRAFQSFESEMSHAKDLPQITVRNVSDFVAYHRSKATEYLTASVKEIFDWLRPSKHTATGQLKTNSELEVPQKVILGYVVNVNGYRPDRPWSVEYNYRQHLNALERVLYAIDGKGSILKGHESELQTAIESCGPECVGETPLFKFRGYGNGRLHLTFKSADLLERFNTLAGGKTLRPQQSEEDRLRVEIAKARAENERLKKKAA